MVNRGIFKVDLVSLVRIQSDAKSLTDDTGDNGGVETI